MIGLIHDIFNIADRYGLKILNIDTTDVTLMARIDIDLKQIVDTILRKEMDLLRAIG